MSDHRTQVNFTVDKDAHERAKKKADHGELSARLRETIQELAYGTEVTERKRLKEKLEDMRSEKRDINNEIENLRHEREQFNREISRVEDRLDCLMENEGEYDGFLKAIEVDLHDGMRVDPQHGMVERAAELGDCEPVDVMESLRERNPKLPDVAFRTPDQGESANWKNTTI